MYGHLPEYAAGVYPAQHAQGSRNGHITKVCVTLKALKETEGGRRRGREREKQVLLWEQERDFYP